MNKLVIANLLHRPLRSIISVLAVAIEVIMILSIVGIFMGMLNDQKERTNGIGADLLLRPTNASFMNGVGGAPMPAKNIEAIRKLPHVAVASPVIQHLNTAGSIEVLWGIDYPSFNALKPFVFVAGGPFQGPAEVIADDVFARADGGHKVGDTIQVMNHPFRISGIVEHGKGGRKLLSIETMGELTGDEGKASLFLIKCDNPANQQTVIQEIHATPGLENNEVETIDDWLAQMTPEKLPGFNSHRWLPGDLPVDVYGGSRADPRDRHSQIAGIVQADHCQHGVARDCLAGHRRRIAGRRGYLRRSYPAHSQVPHTAL
jgi:putative ABC transport system permease protein